MANEKLDLTYDFICLCCGGRNGEDHPACSVRNYLLTDEAREHLSEWHQEQPYDFNAWFASDEYFGSVIIPAHYVLSEDHRKFLAELAGAVNAPRRRPFLVQSILCDDNIPDVYRLPAYDVTQFDN